MFWNRFRNQRAVLHRCKDAELLGGAGSDRARVGGHNDPAGELFYDRFESDGVRVRSVYFQICGSERFHGCGASGEHGGSSGQVFDAGRRGDAGIAAVEHAVLGRSR